MANSSRQMSAGRVAGAVAFTGGAAACLLIAGATAQASADTAATSQSSSAAGSSADGESGTATPSEAGPARTSDTSDNSNGADDSNGAADSQGDADDAATTGSDANTAAEDDADAAETAADDEPAEDDNSRAGKPEYVSKSTAPVEVELPAPEVVAVPAVTSVTQLASSQREAAAAPTPSFFTRLQRKFFNKTPTVSGQPDGVVVNADGSVTGVIRAQDADGDVLTYSATALAAGAAVTINHDGSFVYRPATGATANGRLFTVSVHDDAKVNGWHVHGFRGFLIPGYGSTATATVEFGTATAAGKYGWGEPKETRFTGRSALEGWYVYDGVGHNGWGRRTPNAITFVDGVMLINGDAAGNTGGLSWGQGQKYGAWEVRMRVPEGAADYHAVALLWPDAENWPVGGEIDFVEVLNDSTRQNVSHYLHYSAQNRTESGLTKVDATEWHNYAVSWTPQAITIYVDGDPVWKTTNVARFPPGPMHLALQLDPSEKHPPNLSGGAQLAVAWARQYSLSQIT